MVIPSYAGGGEPTGRDNASILTVLLKNKKINNSLIANKRFNQKESISASPKIFIPQSNKFIGGPSQPEMSSFKSVGVDNMVNLFTGDFSYNIPLLDVGGYTVNIFYGGSP